MAELTDDVIDTIIAESVGDGVPGMTAVGWAIANRAAKGNTSPDAVVKKPKQFEGYTNPGKGVRAAQNDPRIRAQVKEIWSGIENRTIRDPLQGGTMFHASSMTPYWSDAENKHGTVRIGNQTYYKGGHALPPGDLPAVGTLTDTVPPRTVAPVTPSIDLAQMRRTTPPSRLVADSFAKLPQIPGSRLADNIAISPIQGGRQTAQPFDAAFDTRTGNMRMLSEPETVSSQGLGVGTPREPVGMPRPRPVPLVSASDRARGQSPMNSLTVGGRSPIGLVEPGNLDLNSRVVMNDGSGGYRTENSISIGTDRGEVLIPTVVNGKQLSEAQAIDHYQKTGENLGTFKTPQAADKYAETLHQRQGVKYAPTAAAPPALPRPPAPAPAQQSPQLAGRRATDPVLQTALNSRFPTLLPAIPQRIATPQSQIDRGTSRTVAAAPAAKPRVTVSTPYTTPQSPIERSAARPVTQSPVGQPPATRVVQSVPMPAIPTARQAIPQSYAGMEGGAPRVAAVEERLPSTPMAGRFAAPPPVVFDPSFSTAEVTGTVGQTVRPTGPLAPIPRATIARATLPADPYRAVGTALDTTMPAMPRPRPNLGMGGVDIPGTIAQTGQVAPTPMPRLQRPGLFGRPQLFGHDIPLPGIFGALQGATMAMNNASGPFSNGADNSLYGLLRGGDHNAPGAATAQSGGFLYAPKPGGGFINVGRVNPAQSGAALYDSRTTRNDSRDDAANRVNGGSSRGSGGARSLMD